MEEPVKKIEEPKFKTVKAINIDSPSNVLVAENVPKDLAEALGDICEGMDIDENIILAVQTILKYIPDVKVTYSRDKEDKDIIILGNDC